jgi:CRISPR/Cas system-associated protein Cas10 (large subunit of type III CRISPR-Cas system)
MNSQPAFIDSKKEAGFAADRKCATCGIPLAATEEEVKMHEQTHWVQDKKLASHHPSFANSTWCMYSTQGKIICKK